MAFPSPETNVPRDQVGGVVNEMLLEDQVTEVNAHEDPNGTFTVVPSGAPASLMARLSATPSIAAVAEKTSNPKSSKKKKSS